MSRTIVVIGAGAVGAATALELLRDGHRVTIVEPGAPRWRAGRELWQRMLALDDVGHPAGGAGHLA